jgi:hypothetical protein
VNDRREDLRVIFDVKNPKEVGRKSAPKGDDDGEQLPLRTDSDPRRLQSRPAHKDLTVLSLPSMHDASDCAVKREGIEGCPSGSSNRMIRHPPVMRQVPT